MIRLLVIVPLLMKAVESNEGVTVATKDDDDESAFQPLNLLNDDEAVSPMENEDGLRKRCGRLLCGECISARKEGSLPCS
jgi:hypothetical protein